MPNLFKNGSAGKILYFCILILLCSCPYGYAQKTLKVGVYDNKPIIFVNDKGEVQGLFVDLLEEIAIKENWRLEYVVGHFSDVFAQLKEGEIDIFPALAYSKQREAIIDYTSETILSNWAEIYVPSNKKFTSLLELEGKKVGVIQGDIHFTALKELTGHFNISCRFIEVFEYETVFEMLQANFVHAGVVNRLYENRHNKEYSVKRTPVVFNPIEMRFGAAKDKHQDILTKIDSYMLSYLADGHSIYYQLIDRWLAVDTKEVFPRWLFYSFITIAGATLVFFGAALLFRRQVQRRTKELTNTNLLLKSQILERTKAEEKLIVAEERSRTWLEHSPVCTKIVDLDFNLQYMSSAGIRSLHIEDITPFYGKPYPFAFYPEAFKKKMTHNLEKARETGGIIEQEAAVVDIDGNELWFHSTIVPVKDDNGRIDYIIIVSVDTTERKKAQTALLENEEKFRNLLESTSTVPWELDFDSFKFTYIGHQIEQMLGYSVKSWKDFTTWAERVHPEDREPAVQFCEIETKKGRNHDFIYRAIHKDGSYRWIRDVVSVVMDSGTPKKLIGFMQDITNQKEMEHEQKLMEMKLQQSRKMEAIGTLAGGIAHDFNNMLGAIIGYAEMIRDDFPPDSPGIHDIDQVLSASHRAKELVKQILTFSRQDETNKIPIQPAAIVKEAIKMLRPSLPTTIKIEQDLDSNAGKILADPNQFHQIIVNLCTNALHAMEVKGGTLTLSLHKIDLEREDLGLEPQMQPGKYLRLSIKDTGEGIKTDIKEKIFDPFFTTKEVGKGTGIGLATVYGIVQSLGGSIIFDSRSGEGTVFHVTLPTVEEYTEHDSESNFPAPQRGSERILLVDDEEMLAELGKTMLEKLGYSVTTCGSSPDAWEIFQNQPDAFDLLITDQTMPIMTGVDLSRRILQIRPELPIILCTGYSLLISEEKAKSYGIKGFAMKPLAKNEIAELIRNILDKE